MRSIFNIFLLFLREFLHPCELWLNLNGIIYTSLNTWTIQFTTRHAWQKWQSTIGSSPHLLPAILVNIMKKPTQSNLALDVAYIGFKISECSPSLMLDTSLKNKNVCFLNIWVINSLQLQRTLSFWQHRVCRNRSYLSFKHWY